MTHPFQTDIFGQWLLPAHRSLAMLTITLFIWRGIYIWRDKPMHRLYRRWIPDMIDVLLLSSGALLAFTLGFAPWHNTWLAVKISVIILYIMTGFFAFRSDIVIVQRGAFFLSLLLFVYVVSIAHTMSPTPW